MHAGDVLSQLQADVDAAWLPASAGVNDGA
jgi:hypothetical protein